MSNTLSKVCEMDLRVKEVIVTEETENVEQTSRFQNTTMDRNIKNTKIEKFDLKPKKASKYF